MKKFQYLRKVLGLSFIFAITFSLGNGIGAENFLASSMDVAIIPGDSSDLAKAFQTGNFSFSLILGYGMYLINLMGVLAGIVGVIFILIRY